MVLDRKKSPIDLATSLHDVEWEEVNVEKAQEWAKIPTCRQIVFSSVNRNEVVISSVSTF